MQLAGVNWQPEVIVSLTWICPMKDPAGRFSAIESPERLNVSGSKVSPQFQYASQPLRVCDLVDVNRKVIPPYFDAITPGFSVPENFPITGFCAIVPS